MRRRLALASLCFAALALVLPATVLAAHSLRFTIEDFAPAPGVHQYFEGLCGAAVDSHGDLYISDYYHDGIDVFSPSGAFITEITGVSPLDGPCGLAVDSAGRLYANAYHQGVLELTPGTYPPVHGTTYSAPTMVVGGVHATGIALDPLTGNLLVDERTSVAEYESPVVPESEPLQRIGTGSLEDGYGVAASGYGTTQGFVYVADAASSSVKVYNPATSLTAPVATINGGGTPLGRFNDLVDAALAVDDSDGHLYVVDNVDGQLYEHPRAGIEEFDATGAFVGEVLPPGATGPALVDGQPTGLAVDNTGAGTQGDLYVSNGNTEESRLLAFGPTVAGAALASESGSGSTPSALPSGAGAAASLAGAAGAAQAPPAAGQGTAAAGSVGSRSSGRRRVHRGCAPHHHGRRLCKPHRHRKGRRTR